MHLRSMRREVYVKARDQNLPLIVVWIQTPFHTAIARNESRDEASRVSEEAIHKINNDIHCPDRKYICDRNNLTIIGDDNDSIAEGIAAIVTMSHNLWRLNQEEMKLREQMESSIKLVPIQQPSVVKELDQSLRNVGHLIIPK